MRLILTNDPNHVMPDLEAEAAEKGAEDDAVVAAATVPKPPKTTPKAKAEA